MNNDERKAQLWKRVDDLHNLVNMISAEQARLVPSGSALKGDLITAREKLIEEADGVLAELERLYAGAKPATPNEHMKQLRTR